MKLSVRIRRGIVKGFSEFGEPPIWNLEEHHVRTLKNIPCPKDVFDFLSILVCHFFNQNL